MGNKFTSLQQGIIDLAHDRSNIAREFDTRKKLLVQTKADIEGRTVSLNQILDGFELTLSDIRDRLREVENVLNELRKQTSESGGSKAGQ